MHDTQQPKITSTPEILGIPLKLAFPEPLNGDRNENRC